MILGCFLIEKRSEYSEQFVDVQHFFSDPYET